MKLGRILFYLAILTNAPFFGEWLTSVHAAEHPLQVTSAHAGFAGKYKAGRWTPLLVEIKSTASVPLEGEASCRSLDGDGVPVIYRLAAGRFKLQPNERIQLPLIFQAGSIDAQLQLHFRLSDGTEWNEPLDVPSPSFATRETILQIGPSVGLEEIHKYFRRRDDQAFQLATVTEVSQLPVDPRGYEGLDWVFLPLSKASLADQLSAEQRAAITSWVRTGGRLVLSCGSRAQANFGPTGPWREFAAGEVSGASRLQRTVGLETIGGTTLDIDTLAAAQAPFVIDYTSVQGRVDLWQVGGGVDDRPLVIRRAFGLGQVLVIGFDLDQSPWKEWNGRPRMLGNLLLIGRRQLPEQDASAVRGQATHLGYDDITGQLRTALEQYRHVIFLTFTAVAVMAGGYLLLIGPGDYFLLTWLGWPKHWTWVTFSLCIVALCAAGWWLADHCHGRQVWLNPLEIVDVDLASGTIRGTGWGHLYSPTSRRFQLSWQPSKHSLAPPREATLSWHGLAGRGWGGLNRNTPGANYAFQQQQGYVVDATEATSRLTDLPIAIAGSKPLSITWHGEVSYPHSTIQATSFGQLSGEIVNPFPFELTDCRVLYADFMYRAPKVLAAGQAVSLTGLSPMNLESRLTERMVVEQKDMATPWNPARTDLPRIVEMLMFHEAGNGAGYTGLLHRFQPWLDLSDHLRMDRVILVGASTHLQGEWFQDGTSLAPQYDPPESEPRAWYRLIVPVIQETRKNERENP